MHPHRKLSVWRKAHELTLRIYRFTDGLGRSYTGLTHQLRGAAQSVPANIAEGLGRPTNAQFAHHLQIAIASARELDYYLLLARDLEQLGLKDHAILEARTDEVTRMLVALRRTVAARGKAVRGVRTQKAL